METMHKGTSHLKQIPQMKKIEGQVRGIIKMIEEERYCIDILHQFKAVQSALNTVELKILKSHVEGCLKDSIKCKDSDRTQELIDEVMDIVTKVKKGRL
jgi:CsoR family transcriptional regulator, copper-sensing transcriptional repressor